MYIYKISIKSKQTALPISEHVNYFVDLLQAYIHALEQTISTYLVQTS